MQALLLFVSSEVGAYKGDRQACYQSMHRSGLRLDRHRIPKVCGEQGNLLKQGTENSKDTFGSGSSGLGLMPGRCETRLRQLGFKALRAMYFHSMLDCVLIPRRR